MILVDSIDDPRIAEFTHMRDHTLNEQGLILAESEKIFLQYRSSKRSIKKILCTIGFADKFSLVGDHIFIADKYLLEKIAGFKVHFEVIFLAEKPLDTTLDLLDDHVILLNGLTSPENVGSIVRSAAAFRVNSIITDEKTCSPFLRRCIRVSMGNIFFMKTFHSTNIRSDLYKLKNDGYSILSSANISGSLDLNQFVFPKKCILIIGSEGHGIDQDIIELSDSILKIPIDSQVAHLNASNAAAIFLSHMGRVQ